MFTFKFDTTTAIYVAYAVLEKADREDRHADELRGQADASDSGLAEMLGLQALQARNRAKLLRDAGKTIKRDVHNGIVGDFIKSIPSADK